MYTRKYQHLRPRPLCVAIVQRPILTICTDKTATHPTPFPLLSSPITSPPLPAPGLQQPPKGYCQLDKLFMRQSYGDVMIHVCV